MSDAQAYDFVIQWRVVCGSALDFTVRIAADYGDIAGQDVKFCFNTACSEYGGMV